MKIAGICFLALGIVLLLISGLYLGVYLIFEKLPHKTGRTLGKLHGSKHKKDVAVWTGFGKHDGPPRVAFTIKHLTKTKYAYSVNNKLYLCVFDFQRKPHKLPNSSWVIYLKAFPRISYLDNDENCIGSFTFFAKAIIFLGIAICTLSLGVTFLKSLVP
jgi:hypothetical protein